MSFAHSSGPDAIQASAHPTDSSLLQPPAHNVSKPLLSPLPARRQLLINLCTNALKFTLHGAVTVRVSVVSTAAAELSATAALQANSPVSSDRHLRGGAHSDPRTAHGGHHQSQPGGRLTWPAPPLNVAAASRHFRIDVEDTGCGLSAEELERVFLPFVTMGESNPQGLGLGLPICLQLAKAMGGTLGVVSTLARGSRFHFTLPIRDCDFAGNAAGSVASALDVDNTQMDTATLAALEENTELASPRSPATPCPLPILALLADDDPFCLDVEAVMLRKL